MRICPYCSAENADKAIFCLSCGSSLKNALTKKIPVEEISKANEEAEHLESEELFEDPEKNFYEIDEAMEFERQLRRYMREQGNIPNKSERRRGRKEDKKIKLIGVIGVLAVLVCGILAFNMLGGAFTGRKEKTTTAKLSDDMIKELTREKESEVELAPTESAQPEKEEAQESAPVEEQPPAVSASMMLASDLNNEGYERVTIVNAEASSVIEQEGFDNSPARAVDGNTNTSWQEGVNGPGLGETIDYTFDRTYSIHSMTFKLGNWASESYFWKNNRPETMTIWLDDVGFEVTFPDGMEEYAIQFTEDVQASSAHFEIESVYEGNEYDDTCIADIGIYGA